MNPCEIQNFSHAKIKNEQKNWAKQKRIQCNIDQRISFKCNTFLDWTIVFGARIKFWECQQEWSLFKIINFGHEHFCKRSRHDFRCDFISVFGWIGLDTTILVHFKTIANFVHYSISLECSKRIWSNFIPWYVWMFGVWYFGSFVLNSIFFFFFMQECDVLEDSNCFEKKEHQSLI